MSITQMQLAGAHVFGVVVVLCAWRRTRYGGVTGSPLAGRPQLICRAVRRLKHLPPAQLLVERS